MQIRCGRGWCCYLLLEISIDEIRLQKALSSSLLELCKKGKKCPSVPEVIGEIPELKWGAKLKDFESSFQLENVMILIIYSQTIFLGHRDIKVKRRGVFFVSLSFIAVRGMCVCICVGGCVCVGVCILV